MNREQLKPTPNIVANEPPINESSKPKDEQLMKRVVDASPVVVVKLLSTVRLPAVILQ